MNSVVYEDEKIVAILHDIVEDTPIGVPDLEKDLELPKRIIDAIVAMTHEATIINKKGGERNV